MGAGTVIKEFLASVGFKADEKSLKASLTKVAAFGATVQMMAVGIYAGLVKVASGEAEMARQAEKLGTTSDKLQELGYIAEQSGSSLDAVTRSMESLVSKNPRIKDAAKALEVAGDRMKRMNDMQRKAYAARMGIDPSLIPALISDASALKDEFRAMYEVAGIDAKEAGKASKEFMGEIGKLSTMVGLLAKSVSLAFIGKIRHDVANLRKVIMENFDKIKRLFEGVIKIVLRIAAVISAFAYRVITWISALVSWFDKLDDGQKQVIVGVGLLLAAWKLLNAGFLATPIGMIITGLLGIVALVDDYLTYMEGGESYFDWGPWADTIEEVVNALKPVLGVVFSIGKGIASAIGPALKVAIDTIGRVINIFKLLGQYVLALFSGDFGKAADLAIATFSNLGELILGVFTGLGSAIKTILGSLWDGVVENFPDFGAWAAGAVKSMRDLFGKGIQWIKDKISSLVDFLPDWVLEKMGMKPGGGDKDKPEGGGPGNDADFDKAINDALAASQAASTATLTPSPAQAAGMTQNTQQNVTMEAKTEIHMHTSDPVAAGNQAADRQAQVNADTVRHMKGAAK